MVWSSESTLAGQIERVEIHGTETPAHEDKHAPKQTQTESLQHQEDRPEDSGAALGEPEDVNVEHRVAHVVRVGLEIPLILLLFVVVILGIVQILVRRDLASAPPTEADEIAASHVLRDPEVETSREQHSHEDSDVRASEQT